MDEKEPVAFAQVVVIEASDMKPSDLNGYPFIYEILSVSYVFSFINFVCIKRKKTLYYRVGGSICKRSFG